jgi:hypothetical protein
MSQAMQTQDWICFYDVDIYYLEAVLGYHHNQTRALYNTLIALLRDNGWTHHHQYSVWMKEDDFEVNLAEDLRGIIDFMEMLYIGHAPATVASVGVFTRFSYHPLAANPTFLRFSVGLH